MSYEYMFWTVFLYAAVCAHMVAFNRYADRVQSKIDEYNKDKKWASDQYSNVPDFRYTTVWVLCLALVAAVPFVGIIFLALFIGGMVIAFCVLLSYHLDVTDKDSHPSFIKFFRKTL